METLILGFIIGNAFCYLMLFRPIIKLKDDYINRLNKRLEER